MFYNSFQSFNLNIDDYIKTTRSVSATPSRTCKFVWQYHYYTKERESVISCNIEGEFGLDYGIKTNSYGHIQFDKILSKFRIQAIWQILQAQRIT